jgi:hypothetical protein
MLAVQSTVVRPAWTNTLPAGGRVNRRVIDKVRNSLAARPSCRMESLKEMLVPLIGLVIRTAC